LTITEALNFKFYTPSNSLARENKEEIPDLVDEKEAKRLKNELIEKRK